MSYQAIARKYRPQTFSEVIGQEPIIRTLQNAIETNKVAHAYIFSGTRGVGKTTTARILAKALNCEKGPTTKPCGQCPPCTEIAAAAAVDVIEIDAASNRGIDEIRELRESVRYLPARDRNKIFIIDEVHMLTNEAFNALLKTLEEPPERVVFILATTEPHRIPATIHSRCQNFHFRTVGFQEILNRLEEVAQAEKVKIDKEALAIITRGAEGSLRDSLSLLDQVLAYCGKKITSEAVRELLGVVGHELLDRLVEAIREQSSEKVLQLVDELVRDGHNLQHFCREALRHLRNLLVARIGGEASALVEAAGEEKVRLEATARGFAEEDLLRYFNILMRTESELRFAPQPRLHLELGLLKMVQAGRLVPLEEVLASLEENTGASPAPARSAHSAAPTQPAPARTPPRSAAPQSAPQSAQQSAQQSSPPFSPRPSSRPSPPSPPPPPLRTTAPSPEPAPAPDATQTTSATPSGGDALPGATVETIKTAVYDTSKFLGSLVENVSRWEQAEDGLLLWFAPENRTLIEMLSKQQLSSLEKIISQVLGRPQRVYVKIDSGPEAAGGPDAENGSGATHPTVQALLSHFGGQLRPARSLPSGGGKPRR